MIGYNDSVDSHDDKADHVIISFGSKHPHSIFQYISIYVIP